MGREEEPSQDEGVGEEALGEAEQQSRAAEQELQEYLQRDALSASLTNLLDGGVCGPPAKDRKG